jgi:hypothetical protein
MTWINLHINALAGKKGVVGSRLDMHEEWEPTTSNYVGPPIGLRKMEMCGSNKVI